MILSLQLAALLRYDYRDQPNRVLICLFYCRPRCII
jgi:hypothetical protein